MTTALELWDKLRQQPPSWLPTERVYAFVVTLDERETLLKALHQAAVPEGVAIDAIREHNDGCDAACVAQRPNERQSGGCGYQKHDGSLVYGPRRCPSCPQDWKIELAGPQHSPSTEPK